MDNTVPGYTGLNESWNKQRRVQIEPSTRCPLLCPDCARTKIMESKHTEWNGDSRYRMYPDFRITDLSIENFKHFIRPENKLKWIHYNANLSDPIWGGNILEQLALVNKMEKRPRLYFSTNGSGKSSEWWYNFATKLQPGDYLGFAIDGLEDTNHIYRINADWQTIINGLKVCLKYRKPGVAITWRYIVFQHNKHQVFDAYDKSVEMGVDIFKLVKAAPRTGGSRQITLREFEKIESELLEYAKKNLPKM